MGQVSTITIGADTYSVYALTADPLEDAQSYMDGRFGTTAWAGASPADQQRALISAARWLDRQVWDGTPTDVTTPQALAWPRTGMPNCDGIVTATTTVPTRVVHAEFELAQIILADSTEQESAGQGTNVKRVKAGSAEVEFFQNDIGTSRDTNLPPIAHELVRCFLGSGDLGIPHVSGSGKASLFNDDGSSNLSKGLA